MILGESYKSDKEVTGEELRLLYVQRVSASAFAKELYFLRAVGAENETSAARTFQKRGDVRKC